MRLAPERAGVAYFAVVFVAGFAMGTMRVLLVEPRLGPVWSVALELPVMLALSWSAARWLVRRLDVRAVLADRLRMGLVGVALLVAAETALGAFAFGIPVAAQFSSYATQRGLLTLVGQVGFALFPLIVARRPAGAAMAGRNGSHG